MIALSRDKCPRCGSKRVSIYTGQGRSWCRKCRNNWNWDVEKEEIIEDIHKKRGWVNGELTREKYKDKGTYAFSVIKEHFDDYEDARKSALDKERKAETDDS